MAAVPEYITKELFETALRKFLKDTTVRVLGYTTAPAIPQGDNHASELFRSSVIYQAAENGNKSTISVIIKCSPLNEKMLKVVTESRYFENEIEIYCNILPLINDILGDMGPISAKCIYFEEKPNKLIIFEDLYPLGFKMLNRHQGFDLDHCLLTIENIAKLHAGSLVLSEKDPDLISKYTDGIFRKTESLRQSIKSGFNSLIKVTAKWPGYEKYSSKLKALGNKLITKSFAAARPKLGAFNVLNHGDAWVNNFMLSYTPEGKLKDFRFVDFQLTIYSSPAFDLHFFWVSTPTVEVKKHHLGTILDHYYSSLLSTLTKLEYTLEKIPTREQLQEEFHSTAFYGLLVCAVPFALIKSPRQKDSSFDDLMESNDDDGFRYNCYNNEEYRKHTEFLLPFYDKLGALDDC